MVNAPAAKARPATRTFVPVTEESYGLHKELATRGLDARDLRARTSALTHHLRLAGSTTREQVLRDELRVHVDYWAGIRRIATGGWDPGPELEPFDPDNIRDFGGDIVAVASSRAGLGQYQVQDLVLNAGGRHIERFLAEGCRFVGGAISGLAAKQVTLDESGLFGIALEDLHVDGTLSARFTAGISARVTAGAGSIDLTRGVYRHCTFTLSAHEHARFDAADLSHTPTSTIKELLLLVDLPPWQEEEAAAVFVDCSFGSSSYEGALLQGCVFERCELGTVSFGGAYVDGCRFTDCSTRGEPLTLDHLRGAIGEPTISTSQP